MSGHEQPARRREYVLFVYDAAMSGLPDAAQLAGARPLGPASTEPGFELVDLGAQIALVPSNSGASVRGEVYSLDVGLLASIDIKKGHPARYRRARIKLDDGREADAYVMEPDQVRGKRRISSGDYRGYLAPAPAKPESAWSQWARKRR